MPEDSAHQRKSANFVSKFDLAWHDINYSVRDGKLPCGLGSCRSRKMLLQSVTGVARGGEVMALMGPSGSGKTTLLNILSDTISPEAYSGHVYVNGQKRKSANLRNVASYVAADSSFHEVFSVKETLTFTARIANLQQSYNCHGSAFQFDRFNSEASLVSCNKSKNSWQERVDRVIDLVGLGESRDVWVGGQVYTGLSTGQKRRLSIAEQLIKEPHILLLDEPLSGLDSAAATGIMNILQELSRDGKTIILSIHQPSIRIWQLIDSITLLSSGTLVYCGPRKTMLDFLESASGATMMNGSEAEFTSDLLSTDFEDPILQSAARAKVKAIAQKFAKSNQMFTLQAIIEEARCDFDSLQQHTKLENEQTNKAGFCKQFALLTHRAFVHSLRNIGMVWARVAIYLLLSLIIGGIFCDTDGIEAANKAGMLFFVQSYVVILTVAALPFLIIMMPVFVKERRNGSVDTIPFVLSSFVASIPGIILSTTVSVVIIHFLTDLHNFAWFFAIIFATLLCAESLMNVVSAMTSNLIVALAIAAGVYGIFMINAGFLVPKELIPNTWHTLWRFFHYASFHCYSLRSIFYNEFRERPYFVESVSDAASLVKGDVVNELSQELTVFDDTIIDSVPDFAKNSVIPVSEIAPLVGELISPILQKYGFEDVNLTKDFLILIVYALCLQIILLVLVYFKHTGRRGLGFDDIICTFITERETNKNGNDVRYSKVNETVSLSLPEDKHI
ncbi:uncharacterized protein LOC142339069 isoform X2 [Convolutriloba macropyga]|uniref:uncharacterized protein LOC142339069 isoform X2 n=1 Tax=Convolutriloba macropyga TaxID=536237 RepID=UPI003F5220AF